MYSYRWQRARIGWLRKHPLCAECERHGRVTQAVVVDHIQAHHGDTELFWDRTNWQSLCKHCHDSHKQRFEKSGRVFGCTEDGQPINPAHGWNQP
uniref:HNH endonuclease n=1 Tax=Pseudomonas lundensis TaxID=86185 RepID=UPI0028D5F55A|nr:HNH endonuclease [Pseudomonas lundensis]